jgi:hypothetical protein
MIIFQSPSSTWRPSLVVLDSQQQCVRVSLMARFHSNLINETLYSGGSFHAPVHALCVCAAHFIFQNMKFYLMLLKIFSLY